jgi:hypothetical protein
VHFRLVEHKIQWHDPVVLSDRGLKNGLIGRRGCKGGLISEGFFTWAQIFKKGAISLS